MVLGLAHRCARATWPLPQRIRYASNEANYCPHCQTDGKLLADRALSRLLREDWPRTPDALESFIERRRSPSEQKSATE